MQFLTNLDLAKNELQNARVQNLASAPASPVTGQLYYDSAAAKLRWWNGSAWIDAAPGAGTVTAVTASAPLASSGGAAPNITLSPITDANIASGAAIAKAKLAALAIADADVAVGAAIAYAKLAAPIAAVSMNSQRITSVADPTSAQDAATKAYVDALSVGLDPKASVRTVATDPITLSGLQSVNSVTVAVNDRVLVVGQVDSTQNGIYLAQTGAWVRSGDANTSAEVTAGMYVFVEEGDFGDSGWVLTTNNPITLSSTNLSFTQFTGAGQIVAGAGLTKSANTLNAVGTAGRILVGADAIDLDPAYVAPVSQGGTGGANAIAAKANLGYITPQAFNVGDGAATSYVITHGLGTRDVLVVVYRSTTPWDEVEVDIEHTSTTTATLRFALAPATNAYRAVFYG